MRHRLRIFLRPGGPSVLTQGRRRRSNRSSSDEDPVPAWDGFIEEDLRAGGPVLCEAPYDNVPITKAHPHFESLSGIGSAPLISRIKVTASQSNLPVLDVYFIGRRPHREPESQPITSTAVIVTRRQSAGQGCRIQVARNIRAFLNSNGINDISVEIVDERFGRGVYIFPCMKKDRIFPIWETVAQKVIDTISLTGILSIGCHRIGESEDMESCAPTVLITVAKGRWRQNWKALREVVVQILDDFNLPMVAVIIRKDVTIERSSQRLTPDGCTASCNIGYSLALHNSNHGQGTLGGWIELKDPNSGRWVPFGITCAHCILPPHTDFSKEDIPVVDRWRREGVPIGDSNSQRLLVIDSPASIDVERGIKRIEAEISDIENSPDFKSVEEAHRRGEFVIPLERGWKVDAQVLSKCKAKKQKMEAYLHKNQNAFGTVFASSGLQELCLETTTPNSKGHQSIMDWALIKPYLDRIGSNDISNFEMLRNKVLTDFLPPEHGLEVDEALYKIGRKTGATIWRYNGLKEVFLITNESGGEVKERVTWEHCMVIGYRSTMFAAAGDSDALVFNTRARVVSLCFGGTNAGGIGYFTHIHDLIAHIKMLTGVRDIRVKFD